MRSLLISILLALIAGCPDSIPLIRQDPAQKPVIKAVKTAWLTFALDNEVFILYGPPQHEWEDGVLTLAQDEVILGDNKLSKVLLILDSKHGYAKISYQLDVGDEFIMSNCCPPEVEIEWATGPLDSSGPLDSYMVAELTLKGKDNDKAFISPHYTWTSFSCEFGKDVIFRPIQDACIESGDIFVREITKKRHFTAGQRVCIKGHYLASCADQHSVEIHCFFEQDNTPSPMNHENINAKRDN